MRNFFYGLCTVVCLSMILVSCSDDEVSQPASVSPDLGVQFRVGSETLTTGESYTINGTAIQIDVASFYLGNVEFSGDTDFAQNDYFAVNSANNSLNLGTIDEGTYDFSFGIGIDADTNSQTEEDFTTRATGDPLGLQTPSMHWNWNSGYKFLRVDGQVDTDADGIVDTPVEYHLGSNDYFATLDAPSSINITPENNTITIRFDIEGLLNDVEISDGESTHVGDNVPRAQQLLSNYTTAFSIIQ